VSLGVTVLSDAFRQKPRTRMKEPQLNPHDLAPAGPTLTAFDEEHVITYLVCLMPMRKAPTGARSRGSFCTLIRCTSLAVRDAPSRAALRAPNG